MPVLCRLSGKLTPPSAFDRKNANRPPSVWAVAGLPHRCPRLRFGVLLVMLLVAACQPGPPPTPTVPPSLDYTFTPTWPSPTVTRIPSLTATQMPTATSTMLPSTATPIVATFTPSSTQTAEPPAAVPPTLPPAPPATLPPLITTPLPVTAAPGAAVYYEPSALVNPLPLPAVVPVANLPRVPVNTGFEGAAVPQGAMEIVVPQGWTAWWRDGAVDCAIYAQLGTTGPCPVVDYPDLTYKRPEFSVISSSAPWLDPPRIYGQGQAARFFCTFGICVGGYLQRVQVTPGQRYTLSAQVHSWCTDDSGNHQRSQLETRDDQLNCELALGIDPTGGADPLSHNIIWNTFYAYDTYTFLSTPAVVASGSAMTLYLRGRNLWALRHNDFHFDQVTFGPQ